ncbi:MAG TPA: tRNA (adenosine(37)-N6)-threonylcarbamoyltransferase complex dimerization subunit type 1 TsaB [Geobacteraceae bacterium]|nr:tRNA (adenosine(37)-N6)-threonylcarbamoyltransferase complex dimerization subunit type 1 TsaB [Geobacteraceae bacterium]
MNILTIDTSTTVCSVALTMGDRVVAETLLNMEKTHASRLLNLVDMILCVAGLDVKDLDGFAVALGPGSFTGLRVGIATVKGLALASNKPVCGFSSLAMLAMNIPWAAHPVCPMFDAKKKEVYTALYNCRELPSPLINDCVVSPGDFLEKLEGDIIFVGAGALTYRELIVDRLGARAFFAPLSANLPRASNGAELAKCVFAQGAAVLPAALVPCYIRPSEAELAKMKR